MFSESITKFTLSIICLLVIRPVGWSQDSTWSLDDCIQYAQNHNISIQESKINERIAEMQINQSKLAMLPSVSFSSSYGSSFGRSINPTSNEFENSTYQYAGVSGGSSIDLFSWFQNWHILKKSKFTSEAAKADREQLEYNTTLNVAAAYLNILLASEQIKISEAQLNISEQNIKKTDELRLAGKSNGLDVSKVHTQLMQDSTSYLTSVLSYKQSILALKAILNIEFAMHFNVEAKLDNTIPFKYILSLNPEMIFKIASSNQAIIKGDELRLAAAKEDVIISKRKAYPSITAGYSFGTSYSSSFFENLPNGEVRLMNLDKQLRNNISNSIYLSVSIPVFNGLSNRFSTKQARFNVQQNELKRNEDLLQLKQEIYQAWNDVVSALQVYRSAKSTEESTIIGYKFAKQRYDLGFISASDLVLAQNDMKTAKFDVAARKYDLLFKVKIIEYYQHHVFTD